MKILLVGANGQVGREIQDLFNQKEIDLVSFSRQQLDITNLHSIETQLAAQADNATCLINVAAYTAVDKAENESQQAFQVNRDGALNLATFCQKYKLPLIHLSTDYVFSGAEEQPYKEEEPASPINVYGQSKLEGEQAIQNNLEQYIILRVSWVFGQYGHNFVKTILRLASEREELKIVADQYGNPTAAEDIAKVLLTIVGEIAQGNTAWGVYHYSNTPQVSWCEFAEDIVEVGRKANQSIRVKTIEPILTSQFPTPAKRPMNSGLCCDKIHENFGVKCASWRSYLVKVIQDINKNV